MAGGDQGDIQEGVSQKDVRVNAPSTVKRSWKDVGFHTLACFRTEFQAYFPPALLASAVAYLCIYLLEMVRKKLVVHHSFESAMEPARFVVPSLLFPMGRTLISSIQWWFVWLVLSFMLASVALRMLSKDQSTDAAMGLGDAFRNVCGRRLGALITLSTLAGLGTVLFSVLLLPLLLRPLPLLLFQLHLFDYYSSAFWWVTLVFTLIFAALLNKMFLAVPELVFDKNISIGKAIRNSISATAGWEVFFLLEFGALGLLGGILYFLGGNLLEGSWKHSQLTQSGYELMLAAFTILLASLALTLLSISQSLVYMSLRPDVVPSPAPESAASGI